MTLRLNAGDETRIMEDMPDGRCVPLCFIFSGGMTGRSVAESERIAADLVARYNALATIPDPQAFMEAARGMRVALVKAGDFIQPFNRADELLAEVDAAIAAFDATLGEQ